MRTIRLTRLAIIFPCLLFLAACSGKTEPEEPEVDPNAPHLIGVHLTRPDKEYQRGFLEQHAQALEVLDYLQEIQPDRTEVDPPDEDHEPEYLVKFEVLLPESERTDKPLQRTYLSYGNTGLVGLNDSYFTATEKDKEVLQDFLNTISREGLLRQFHDSSSRVTESFVSIDGKSYTADASQAIDAMNLLRNLLQASSSRTPSLKLPVEGEPGVVPVYFEFESQNGAYVVANMLIDTDARVIDLEGCVFPATDADFNRINRILQQFEGATTLETDI